MTIPVVTIDGPSGSGKGTVGQLLAEKLGFHYLDSGALYRVIAVEASNLCIDLHNMQDGSVLEEIATTLNVEFEGEQARLNGIDISGQIRTETVGARASKVAALPQVRDALMQRQRAFAQPPGLVADGRDMGTVVFPDAFLKIFLTASPEERAQRRYNQLIHKGEGVSLRALVEEINARDERDSSREISPLKPAEDSVIIDSTSKTIDEVLTTALSEFKKRL